MQEERPIDVKRERGGAADIGTSTEGAITDMFEHDGKLIVIKEKAVYEFMEADHIDPKRENPDLPNDIQRLILNQGSDSEIVCRTLIMAKILFKTGLLKASLDTRQVLVLVLEALRELIAMDNEVTDYLEIEKKVSGEYEERKGKAVSYALPSVSDVITRCKTIFQKADHVTQTLMEIVTHFYPDDGFTKQSHFPKLHSFSKATYGDEDPFTLFIGDALAYLELIRALRNCLDHRLPEVKIKDFELQVNSNVICPTIEIDFRGSKLDRISLNTYLPIATTNILTVFEQLLAYLCDKNVREDRLGVRVRFIPENHRRNKHIQFCFWSPIGKEGFFHQ